MLFSSSVFLFAFFPAVLFIYFGPLRGRRWGQNAFLLLASLFFYAWGELSFLPVMLGSILANYSFGLWVARRKARDVSLRLPLVAAVVFNIGLLFVFKYLTFVLENLRIAGLDVAVPRIRLPIGISFFTFQALSYVLDVSHGRSGAQRSLLNIALYISLFPQLVAGPIVTYETVADQIDGRQETWNDFSSGVFRFLVGLAKKVLISNQIAMIADAAFSAGDGLTASFAWLGAVSYLMQLYFDFGGYSDMAIGLGRMFGFRFLENFNYPLTASSVSDFWRRWHISLTSWFREYVFLPLGGSRMPTRGGNIRNFFLIWLLTGIWHGANWTFVAWGMLNFFMIYLERFRGFGQKWPKPLRHGYTLLVMTLIFVFFRAESLSVAWAYLGAMFRISPTAAPALQTGYYLRQYWIFLLAGILAATPVAHRFRDWLSRRPGYAAELTGAVYDACSSVGLILLFFVVSAFIIKGTYNPFIYFNF